jgi:hypothetical protein
VVSRPDNLDALPFSDYADSDPSALPLVTEGPDVILCAAGCERPVYGHGDYCRRCFRDLNGDHS